LSDRFYEVLSAGIMAAPGLEATAEAQKAARTLGADISSHRSSKLTRDLILSADVLFCMTEGHEQEVLRRAPEKADKILPLSRSQEVSDPIGAGQDVYLATARQIQQAVDVLIDEGKI
jgi:protein-tyrosine-phosphatase